MGNEAIKEIGAACQVSSSRPLQAIGAFPKKFLSRMVGRHFANPERERCRYRKLNPVGVAHRIGRRWAGCWVSSN